MKWFTMAWWSGECEDHEQAGQQYQEHLRVMGDRLHAGLVAFSAKGLLHDTNVNLLSVSGGSVFLRLRARDLPPSVLELRYEGVALVESTYAGDALGGPGGYGDLGYDEVDVDANGLFVHRMLFSTGIQLEVHFTDFAAEQVFERALD